MEQIPTCILGHLLQINRHEFSYDAGVISCFRPTFAHIFASRLIPRLCMAILRTDLDHLVQNTIFFNLLKQMVPLLRVMEKLPKFLTSFIQYSQVNTCTASPTNILLSVADQLNSICMEVEIFEALALSSLNPIKLLDQIA